MTQKLFSDYHSNEKENSDEKTSDDDEDNGIKLTRQ